jgi:hypothetical protein
LAYGLSPLYMPSFTSSSIEHIQYIISSPPELRDKLPLENFDTKLTPSFYSTQEFQRYLLSKFITNID